MHFVIGQMRQRKSIRSEFLKWSPATDKRPDVFGIIIVVEVERLFGTGSVA